MWFRPNKLWSKGPICDHAWFDHYSYFFFVIFKLQEIEKQIVTDVTHLEIPADLALVFANIQGKGAGHSTQEHAMSLKGLQIIAHHSLLKCIVLRKPKLVAKVVSATWGCGMMCSALCQSIKIQKMLFILSFFMKLLQNINMCLILMTEHKCMPYSHALFWPVIMLSNYVLLYSAMKK